MRAKTKEVLPIIACGAILAAATYDKYTVKLPEAFVLLYGGPTRNNTPKCYTAIDDMNNGISRLDQSNNYIHLKAIIDMIRLKDPRKDEEIKSSLSASS